MRLGRLVSVVLAERFSRRGREDSAMRAYLIAPVIAVPRLIYPLMPSPWLAFALGSVKFFCADLAGASQNSGSQTVTPTELRGKVTAWFLFIYCVVGVALSPIVTR